VIMAAGVELDLPTSPGVGPLLHEHSVIVRLVGLAGLARLIGQHMGLLWRSWRGLARRVCSHTAGVANFRG